jgi:DNA end-binding protein Ku
MAARPTWQGNLKLSLVSCPVSLYSATSSARDVSFRMLHKDTHNRIRMIPTDPDLGPVERSDIVKGFEIDKDEYVVVSPEEIKNVRLESTRTIDIDRFVDEADIDRLYWDEPYYLTPDGKSAVEPFTVIREAMTKAGKVALGRVVMHQRERLLAIEPRDNGLLVYSLRTWNEVRDPADFFGEIPDMKADKNMIDIATRIIDQQEGKFEPKQFKDRYEDALRDLIAEKQKTKGRKVRAEAPQEAEVIDLMDALKKSLGESGGKRRSSPSRSRSTARKSAPKKAAGKKKSA